MSLMVETTLNQYIDNSNSLFDLDSGNENYLKEKKDFFWKYESEFPEIKSFSMIHEFILSEILPQYEELLTCDFFNEDIDGNPSNEYYIRFKKDLSIKKRNQLHYEILEKIYNYCKKNNFPLSFKKITLILTRVR